MKLLAVSLINIPFQGVRLRKGRAAFYAAVISKGRQIFPYRSDFPPFEILQSRRRRNPNDKSRKTRRVTYILTIWFHDYNIFCLNGSIAFTERFRRQKITAA